ncbi:MAG: hypothetical protein IKL82_05740 [Clostridia bacterium]|nr:hypothetical protein [Clostridia bacterium]
MKNIKAGQDKFASQNLKVAESQHTKVENGTTGDNGLLKFKDAGELKSAYDSLQAEFTRRSQRLKELEREISALKTSKQPNGLQDLERSGEKGFFDYYPEAQEIKSLLYKIATDGKDEAQGFLERAYVTYLKDKLKSADEKYSSSEYLAEKVFNNTEIKNGIIREYLGSVHASKPTARLTAGNGRAIIAPPSKPQTLVEANEIAKTILEKAKEIY